MIKFEDILEDARRYLDGKMKAEEREKFEQQLLDNPHLLEDLHLMQLMREGFEELENEEKGEEESEEENDPSKFLSLLPPMGIGLAVLMILVILGPKYGGQDAGTGPFPPLNDVGETPEQVSLAVKPEKEDQPALETFGGKNPLPNSDRGLAAAWDPWGDEVFIGGIFADSTFVGDSLLVGDNLYHDLFLVSLAMDGRLRTLKVMKEPGEVESMRDLVVDREGNLLFTGTFGTLLDMGDHMMKAVGWGDEYGREFFIAKIDRSGNTLWTDNTGGVRSSVFEFQKKTGRYNQTGNNQGNALTIDSENNVIVCGQYIGNPVFGTDTLPSGSPNDDLFVAKYTPSGRLQWVRSTTGTYAVKGSGVATDQEDNVYMTGYFGHHYYSGEVYFGKDTLVSLGGSDIFLAKYSPDGDLLWVRQAGDATAADGRDLAFEVAIDAEGNALITGYFRGKPRFGNHVLESRGRRDIFLVKYNSEGEVLWARRAGGDDPWKSDAGKKLSFDRQNNIYLTGSFAGSADFGSWEIESNGKEDSFLAKYSPEGEVFWVRQFGGDGEEYGSDSGLSLDTTGEGKIVVTGFFSGAMKIGNEVIVSSGREDIFILILNTDGIVEKVMQYSHL